jgi:outer membrane protein
LFDERARITQSFRLMKVALFVLALAGITGGALAQESKPQERPITLQESIRLALEHNLDLQIERINPQISLYQLSGAYSAYDPTFSFQGAHDHTESGSRLLGGGFTLPGEISDTDSFSSSLGGATPWGMTYNLRGSIIDSYGNSFRPVTNDLGVVGALPVPFENSRGSVGVDLRQPLLKDFWFDATRLNIRVSKNRVQWSEQNLRWRIMNTVATTEQTYYNLIAARDFVRVQQKAVELAERLLQENRKRVEVGALAPLDEKQAEARTAASKADLIAAQNLVATGEHALKSLLTADYANMGDVELVPTESLGANRVFLNRADSWSLGLEMRPDLRQAKLDAERAGLQVKYARNQLLPQVDVFGSYGYNGTGNEFSNALEDISSRERPFHSYGGQLVVPLANTGARSSYRSSKAVQEQAILGIKRLEQMILVQIDDNIKEVESSYQRVIARRGAREYAEAALEAEQKKLESGKSTSFNVLSLQRDLTEAASLELRALVDYNRSLAQLSLSEGTNLKRHNIDLQVR